MGDAGTSHAQFYPYVPLDVFFPIPSLSMTSSAHLMRRSSSGWPLSRSVTGVGGIVVLGSFCCVWVRLLVVVVAARVLAIEVVMMFW